MEKKIAAVVVTQNRLALLQDCVRALREQTRKPDEIIVVNNASTDGTSDWLRSQSDLTVITQPNLGSAGGQYSGMKQAYANGHDWVWCMDDDSLPARDALEAMTRCPHFHKDSTGFLACLVLWKDGTPHISNGTNPVESRRWIHRALEDRCVEIMSASFVAVMFSRSTITALGFPYKDYFIWGEDIEYTTRISYRRPCYVVLDSITFHQTATNIGSEPMDRKAIKTKCLYRNAITTMLLAPVSLLRKLKRVMGFTIGEAIKARSFLWKCTVIRYSLSGIPFYFRIRKIDPRE